MTAGMSACGHGGHSKEREESSSRIVALSDSLLEAGVADTIDLGRLQEGEAVESELQLQNVGVKPFVILKTETGCGCTQTEYPKGPLRPGNSGWLVVRFDSQGLRGWVFKTVSVYTSLSEKPYVLVITADIR